MSGKDQCLGGISVQRGKEPTQKGATFSGRDGTRFGAVRISGRTQGPTDDVCALENVARNSDNVTNTRTIACRRKGCQGCFTVKNVSN